MGPSSSIHGGTPLRKSVGANLGPHPATGAEGRAQLGERALPNCLTLSSDIQAFEGRSALYLFGR